MHKAYVANWHSKRIGVIDTQHNRYLTDVQIAPSSVASPYGIAFSNDGKTAYITESNCQVIVVDVASSKQTGAVPLDATLCRGGLGTYGIALSPSGKFAYVVTSSFRDSGNNYWDSVALIDVSKNVEMGTVGNFSGGGFWGWSGYSGMIPSPIVFLPGISAQKEGIAYVVSAQTAAVSILSIDGASAIVAGIEPYQGSANTEVTITGKNLLGTTGVTFGGGKAVPEAGSVSDTELKVWAPLPPSFLLNGVGAVSVVVQNPGGDGASPTNFRYTSTINSGGG
jgi:hypothetical protein